MKDELTRPTMTGGYRRISVTKLTLSWWLYSNRHITMSQLRAYFACHEASERRGPEATQRQRRPPRYTVREIALLMADGGTLPCIRHIRRDLRHITKIGLIDARRHSMKFAESADQIVGIDDGAADPSRNMAGFRKMFGEMPHPKRLVSVPRRTVRGLAGGLGAGMTAVVLATLIRSVFWRHEQKTNRVDGRTKASWITAVMGVSESSVRRARARLASLGWCVALKATQWEINRWGRHDSVQTQCALHRHRSDGWAAARRKRLRTAQRLRKATCTRAARKGLTPPRKGLTPPDQTRLSSSQSRGRNNRTLAASPPTGAGISIRGRGWGKPKGILTGRTPHGPAQLHPQGPAQLTRQGPPQPDPDTLGDAPTLAHITEADLADTCRLAALYDLAVSDNLARPGERGWFQFVALAERARRKASRPGSLMAWMLTLQRYDYITLEDEDAASSRLRADRDPESTRPPRTPGAGSGGLTRRRARPMTRAETGRQSRAETGRQSREYADQAMLDDAEDAALAEFRSESAALFRAGSAAPLSGTGHPPPFREFVQ